MEGKLAEIFVQMESKMYGEYIIYDKGKAVLYAEMYKYLYVIITSLRLFWNNLIFKIMLGIYYQRIQYMYSQQDLQWFTMYYYLELL